MKASKLYKIITTLTLLVPVPVYMFILATIYNIHPDYQIKAEFDTISVHEIEDEYFITTTDLNAVIDGVVVYTQDYGYGIYITEKDIIKINKDYYSYIYVEKEEINKLVDIKKFEIQKKESYNIPLVIFISLAGIGIGASIIFKKMQFHKEKPRLAAFVALLTGTIFLYIINTIVANLLGVFIMMTLSWGAYCIEYLVYQGKIDKEKGDRAESDLIRALKEGLK